jgi:predicted RND superfamily exporter protein
MSTAFFDRILRFRWAAVGLVLLATGLGAVFAARVRVDYSIEMAFPRFDESRMDYERYRLDFPLDDAVGLVVVEAGDLFTPAGLLRLAALEKDLAGIEGVVDTWGLTTARDVVKDGEGIRTDLLVPQPDLDAGALERLRRTATTDPLFRWTLAPPDGRATTIQVTLSREHASSEATRTAFLLRAREVVAHHGAGARQAGVEQRITLSGLPVIRSEFTELINRDLGRLFPIALVVILLLLYASFRSLPDVGAALLTIVFSVAWTLSAMGAAGLPLQVLTQVTPIVVMIISISDTSHIVTRFREELAHGRPVRAAIAEACGDSALPCLLTEITIAAGFLGLAFNDMVLIHQFGVATAVGVLLAWVANVTVLPLALSLLGGARVRDRHRGPTPISRAFDRFVAAVEQTVVHEPRAVWAGTAVVVALSIAAGLGVGREYYSYDDLRPEGALFQSLRRVESLTGGTVPFAVFIEPVGAGPRMPDAMLEPEAIALVDRIGRRLETDFPDEVRNAGSVAKYLGKAHRLLVGQGQGPLPATRRLAAQELAAVDDPRALRHLVATDRATAAVSGMVPDHGSSRAARLIARLREYFAREEAAHPYRITLTGIYGIADGIYRTMVGGLVRSLGFAVLISFLTFGLVLRSVRLALVALVPNLLPLLLTLAVMGLLRIDLKPTTVIIFSITLVIADDDTIQYLARFRSRFAELVRAGHPDPHREAALRTLRETAPPMFLTAAVVSAGFAALLFSEFLGLANLGLLIGVSLLSAVFADLFLTPLLLITLRPKLAATREVGSVS